MKNKIAEFIKNSVECLQAIQEGCCRYKLDDRLAIFVGWSAGYGDEKRDDVIQAQDDPDFGINVGIKVWTSDYMQTDYDFLNFPYYEGGDVLDMDLSIAPNDNYEQIADSLLKWYYEINHFKFDKHGKILREKMWVCEHCLAAIESREGNQAALRHDIDLEYDDEDFDEMSECDWCGENGFDTLYELI